MNRRKAGLLGSFFVYGQAIGKEGSFGVEEKLKLYGFNNLTKSLSFNIYDICYAKSHREQQDYIKYIDSQYNSERLTKILSRVTEMIGAHVLNIARQDYDPQGASVTFLIAEEAAMNSGHKKPLQPPLPDAVGDARVVAHHVEERLVGIDLPHQPRRR